VKTVVCFGDSNTWGHVPGSDAERFPRHVRWPARLAAALAEEAEVIAEGLPGRTATIESPVAEGRNGLPYLVPCLRSHAPVDVLVIYLGTNDAYWLEPIMVARSIGRLVKVARAAEAGPDGGAPAVLVVCPPPFGEHELAPPFQEVCDQLGCDLLELEGIATYRARWRTPRGVGPSGRRSVGRGTGPRAARCTSRLDPDAEPGHAPARLS
jgi:lysophospholipase L1-like esterase